MSSQRQVSVRDLVEEGKKRIVILIICVVGLSYLMSLTSSSVWVNLPAAASLIILLRYFSLDYEMRRKAVTYNNKPSSTNTVSQNKTSENSIVVAKSDWKRKVSSLVVEDAIDHFTRHLVSEFVTDLWYSRLTPDQQGPEELVLIMNGVLGEISSRLRNINIIDLLTRDVINLICTHLELFRASQAKIEKNLPGLLSIEQRDRELQRVLAAENRLHPALFSAESEHRVLQHVMDGLISFTFRPEDLKCSVFRYIVRELLACAVMRPVLNLASPRFINERIEIFVISKAKKGAATAEDGWQSKPNGSSKISCDQFARVFDPTATGVELVQLKADQSKSVSAKSDNANGTNFSKDPLLSIDTRSSRSWSSLPLNSQSKDEGEVQNHNSGEFGEMLDMLSRRKTAALAPENFDNMWAKGRNYKNKEGHNWPVKHVSQSSSDNKSVTVDYSKISKPMDKHVVNKFDHALQRNGQTSRFQKPTIENPYYKKDHNSTDYSFTSYDEHDLMHVDDGESGSVSPYTSEEEDVEEDPNSVTGLDDPGTKVWDRKTNRNPVSPIRHPLENRGRHGTKKTGRSQGRYERSAGAQSGWKRSRTRALKGLVWQEIERTSFLSGDGQDILSSKEHAKTDVSSEDSEAESVDRVYSGANACSSALSVSIPKSHSSTSLKNSMMVDSFFKLRCEVLGANIVKSASRTFAVYSISVIDVNNNSWSIKRRFRHFEELHRRLKEYPEYNLHLPPKRFLSTGLDMPVIQERCKLLDRYLKELLQLPRISGSIEVWDFLSVDSQTYVFSNSFSIIETLSVDLDDKPSEKGKMVSNFVGPVNSSSAKTELSGTEHKKSTLQTRHYNGADGVRMNPKYISHSPSKKLSVESGKLLEDSDSDSDAPRNTSSVRNSAKNVKGSQADDLKKTAESLNDASDPTLPTEWVPPNLTAPILDLVDVIFQLQDGGWIRRKAFWVAKQILQLGMGDAVDDWLLEKIQLLRTGSVVASGIKRVEQILWPDGIFITKHPKRRRASTNNSLHNSPHGQQSVDLSSPKPSSPLGRQPAEISSPRLSDEQRQEADRRAKFVYELLIDNAPAAIVGVVGRKEYEQCAKDLYFFLQSSVCLKQLAYDLLELLLLSAFPEMDYVFRQLHEEKHRFGEFKLS